MFQIVAASVENSDEISTLCIDFKIVPDLTYGDVKSRHKEAAKNFSKPKSGRSTSADSTVPKSRPCKKTIKN